MVYEKELTDKIIGAAIEVHRHLGPGLLDLEATYEDCLCCELELNGITFERQKPLPLTYKGRHISSKYRMDLVVAGKVVVELKCVEAIAPVHEAQLLTYLRLSKLRVGLILNFYVPVMRCGIRRLVL